MKIRFNFETVLLWALIALLGYLIFDTLARIDALESRVDGLAGAAVSASGNLEVEGALSVSINGGEPILVQNDGYGNQVHINGNIVWGPGRHQQPPQPAAEVTVIIPGPTMDAIVRAVHERVRIELEGDESLPGGEKP